MSANEKIRNNDDLTPLEFHLGQNYPNPFNKSTKIKFCVPYRAEITISIHDTHGFLLKRLVRETKDAGTYEVEFEADRLPEGIYFCRLKAGEYLEEKRIEIKR